MEWLPLLYEILQVCIIPLLGVLTAFIVKYLKSKTQEVNDKIDNDVLEKYLTMLSDTVAECVIATNQTYVEALKKDDCFTEEAQKEAFQKTYTAVMNILADDAKEYLTAIYGDLTTLITNKIEAEVNLQK